MASDVQEIAVSQEAETTQTPLVQRLKEGFIVMVGMAILGLPVGIFFVMIVQIVFGGFNGWNGSEVRDAYTNEVVKLSSSDYLFQGMRWGTIIGGCLGILGAILLLFGDQVPVGADGQEGRSDETVSSQDTSPK